MMKKLFQKWNKDQNTDGDELNLEYDEFYGGKASEPVRTIGREDTTEANGYYDVAKTAPRGGFVEPDFHSDAPRYDDQPQTARPIYQPAATTADENYFKPRSTWQEEPAREPETVFTPTPAPEYLYFTPKSYRDCREGIVKGLAAGNVVVVRITKMEASDILRLFDYMMGAVQALDAEMLRPLSSTVVLAAKSLNLDEDELAEELEEEECEEYDEDSEDEEGEEYDEYEDDEYEDDEYEEDEYEEDEYEDGEEYDEYEEDSEEDEESDAE